MIHTLFCYIYTWQCITSLFCVKFQNLVSKANKAQAALDTLTTHLKETEILVDNVTNTSLALANTQFIESRVQEDDVEIKKSSEEKQEVGIFVSKH